MPKIAKDKAKWAKNRDVYLNGKPLNHNAAIRARYEKALRTITLQMTTQVKNQLTKLFKSSTAKEYFTMDASITSDAKKLLASLNEKFTTLFASKSIDLATTMVNEAQKHSQKEVKESLEELTGAITLKKNFIPLQVQEVSKAAISENVSLIKSIPSEYFTKINGAVMRSITSGQGVKSLMNHFKQYDNMTDRRAKNIALDQTRKTYNSINAARMESAGYEEFKWLHSGGGLHPRPDHVAMNGKIFRFDDLPVIDKKTGERGLPAQAPNCGCTMQPVYKMPSEQ